MKNIGILAFLILVGLNSCSKNQTYVAKEEKMTLSPEQYKKFKDKLSAMPMIIKVKDEVNNRFVDFDVRNQTVTFNKSWNFANPTPNTIYAQNGSIVVYVSSNSAGWGSGSPTHTVTAGNTTLNVQTLCMAVDASAYAAMFAGQTGALPIDGISIVMGLDADFSLLANSNSTNFANYFHGLAYYLVYDFNASGSYDVIDWTTMTSLPNSIAFAMLFSFDYNSSGAFYFSQDGTINVSGGDMTFNGNYWGIEMDFNNLSPSLTYNSYPGSGTMGCQ
jgi:hypothetical protein